MREIIGKVSGAALGYIHGNIPGAIYGWQAGKYLSQKKSMAPIPKKRKHGSGGTKTTSTHKSTGGGTKHAKYSSSRGRTYRSHRMDSRVVPTTRDVKRYRSGKKVKVKRKRVARITKKFRNKVHKALDEISPNGKYLEIHNGYLNLTRDARYFGYGIDTPIGPIAPDFGNNNQFVYTRTLDEDWNFDSYTFHELMVSLLRTWFDYPKNESWNSANLMTGSDQENFTLYSAHPLGNGNAGIEYFNSQLLQMKYKLNSASTLYQFKNNTNRKYKISYYTCSPKKMLANSQPALQVWKDALANDSNYSSNDVADVVSGNSAYGNQININDIKINTLRCTPAYCVDFKNLYSMNVKTVIAEPGQEWSISVPGPKNVVFDPTRWAMLEKPYSKVPILPDDVTSLGKIQHYTFKPGFSQSMFMVVTPELLPNAADEAARLLDFAGAGVEIKGSLGIAVEKTVKFNWEMPDATAFRRAIALSAFDNQAVGFLNPVLNNRRRRYWHKVWNESTLSVIGDVQRADELVPGIAQDMVTD